MPLPLTRRRGVRAALAALLLLGLILVLLPYGIKWGLERWLARHGAVSAEIGDVDFNPFTGRLAIHTLRAYPDESRELAAEHAVIEIGILPLAKKRIWLQDIRLADARVEVTMEAGGKWSFGGLKFAPEAPEQEPSGKAGWGFGVGDIDLQNVTLDVLAPELDARVVVHSAHLDALRSWEPDRSGNFHLQLSVAGAPLELQGSTAPFGASPRLESSVRIEALPLDGLAPLLAERAGITEAAGKLSAEGTLELAAGTAKTEVRYRGSLKLADLAGQLPQVRVEGGTLDWDGLARFASAEESPPEWLLEGTLGVAGGKVAWSIPDTGYRFSGILDGSQRVAAGSGLEENGLHLTADGDLGLKELTGQLPGVTLDQGGLDWSGRVTVDLAADRPAAVVAAGTLTAGEAAFSQKDGPWRMRQERLTLAGRLDYATDRTPADNPLLLTGTLDGEGLGLVHAGLAQNALRLESLELAGLELTGGAAVRAEALSLADLELLERAPGPAGDEDEPRSVLRLGGLELDGPRLQNGRLTIAQARFRDLAGYLERGPDGEIDPGGWRAALAAPADASSAPPAAADEGEEKPPAPPPDADRSYALASAVLAGDNRLVFFDRAVDPAYRWELTGISASVKDLDSAEPARPATVELQAVPGPYASLEMSGTVAPFAAPAAMDLAGRIAALRLPPLSPYLAEYTGYTVRQGRLDLDLSWPVTDGRVDGSLDILLRRFHLAKAPAAEGGELTRQLDMPLPTALDLMRDGDGNISLQIPISGDLTSPDFRFGAVVMAAIGRTLQKAVVSYYAPLGATLITGGAALPVSAGLFAVRKLLGMATTLRFDPVTFAPGETGFDPAAGERLEQIAKRLGDRPGVRLVLCGLATPADLAALRRPVPEAAKETGGEAAAAPAPEQDGSPPAPPSPETPPPPSPDPTPEERQQLLELARERTEAVKAELVSRGIDPERLFFCAPDIQQEAGPPPRVEIAI